ncbi:MAG: LysM peptidoglycan-binding domain-containing protein [Bacilli bacterium]
MQIHVVQRGQTLAGIASAYDTTVSELQAANGLGTDNRLAIGQSLLIPIVGSFHFVQPGESLWKISRKHGLTVDELARINGIPASKTLQIGERLYIPRRPKIGSIETNGYVQATSVKYNDAIVDDVRTNVPFLTYTAIFSYDMLRDGTLKAPPLEPILTLSKDAGAIPMLAIANLEDGDFSTELASTILRSDTLQAKLISNILETAKKNGMRDIHFDLERVAEEDRENYNQLLRRMRNALPPGYSLSTTLVAKTSDDMKGVNYAGIDYAAHGEIADFVVIMTYDWGWQGGPPQAVSPIGPVSKVIDYAKSKMPANKIMLGQNLYGFDWKIPFKKGNPPAKALSNVGATQLAIREGVEIQYDTKAQAPFFFYTDQDGQKHEVWFEDIRSVANKMTYVNREGLRGISYWKMGLSFPANWLYLDDRFTVVKR